MTTCRDVIKAALRKCAVIRSGRDPTASQSADGMDSLQGLYDGWVDGGSFGQLTEVIASANYTANEQERVISGAYTITLPTTVTDWGCVARPPHDLSMVQVVKPATARQVSVYDALAAGWIRLDGLALADDAPLAARGMDGLASRLAISIAPEFGVDLAQTVLLAAGRFESALGRKASAPSRPDANAEYF